MRRPLHACIVPMYGTDLIEGSILEAIVLEAIVLENIVRECIREEQGTQ